MKCRINKYEFFKKVPTLGIGVFPAFVRLRQDNFMPT